MKVKAHTLLSLLILCTGTFIFTGCFYPKTSWESVPLDSLEQSFNYIDRAKFVTDYNDKSGEVFIEYSLFDKTIQDSKKLNNFSAKKLGYDICGFEGKLKFGSGSVLEYGFIFDVDLDKNSYYLLSITQNGTITVNFFNGNAKPEATLEKVYELLSPEINSLNPINPKGINSVKIETCKDGSQSVSINNRIICSIKNPVNKAGAVGVFQRLDDRMISEYKASNPMRFLFSFTKLQRF